LATFADTPEAEKYIGGIFEAGFADPDVRQALARSGLVLRMNLSQPEAVITADLAAAQVHYGDADAPAPNMTMTLDGETANRFWQGKVSIPLAVARKHITVSGALPKLIALLRHAKTMYAVYIQRLERDNRADLLV
jgi:hypothetical protein